MPNNFLESETANQELIRSIFPTKGPTPLEASYKNSAAGNPDQAAKIISLADKTGQPDEFVAQNLKQAEVASALPDPAYFADIQKKYPNTSGLFADSRIMAAAHDDIQNAADHEEKINKYTLVSGLGRAAVYGLGGLEAQISAIPGFLGIPIGEDNVKYWREVQKSFETPEMRKPALVSAVSGDFLPTAHHILASGPSIVLPTIAAVAGAPQVPILSVVGLLAAAGKYASNIEGGATPATARVNAALTGTYEAGTELVHIRAINKWATALAESFGKDTARQIVKNVGKAVAANFGQEAGEEGTNEALSYITDVMQGIRPWMGISDFSNNVLDAAFIGGVSGGALGGPAAVYIGAKSAQQKRIAAKQLAAQSERAQASKDFFESFGQSAEASKLRARLPEAYRQFVEKMTKDRPVFVDRVALEALLQKSNQDVSKTIEDLGAVDSYLESLSTGDPVKIKLSEMTKLINSGLYAKISGDIKLRHDDFTFNEAEALKQESLKAAEVEVEKAVAEVAPELERSAELKAGYDRVLDHFLKVRGAIPKPEGLKDSEYKQLIKRDSTIAASLVVSRAAREKISVEESLALGPTVTAGEQKVPALQKPGEPTATVQAPVRSSLDISIDPKLTDVKAQADDWLGREATARGMVNDDKFKLQFATWVHFRANKLTKELLAKQAGLPPEMRAKFGSDRAPEEIVGESKNIEAKFMSIFNAYPEIMAKVPKRDPAEEKRILEGFNEIQPPTEPLKQETLGQLAGPAVPGVETVAIGLKAGIGTGLEGSGEIRPEEAIRLVGLISAATGVGVHQITSAGSAYLGDQEGSLTVDVTGDENQIRDFEDMIGYALKQTEVISSRPLDKGVTRGYTLIEESGGVFGGQESAERFVARVREILKQEQAQVEGTAATPWEITNGYQMLMLDGKPSLRFLHGTFNEAKGAVDWTGDWNEKEKAAFQRAASQAADELGVGQRIYFDSFSVISESNAWTEQPSGENYRNSLLSRKRTELAQRLETDNELRLLPNAFWSPPRPLGQAAAQPPGPPGPNVLFQAKTPGDGGKIIRGAFYPSTNTLSLFEQHNQTSFIHEMSHAWLQHAMVFAKSGKADEQYQKDWLSISSYLNILADQDSLTEKQQELWARTVEAYFLKGEAPSNELRFAMRRVKQWFIDIYENLAGLQTESGFEINLSPEVQAVMDRMFATDEQIAEAQRDVGYNPEEVPGLDPSTAEEIRSLQLRSRAAAEEELLKETLKDQLAERKISLDKERAKVTAEVTAAVSSIPLIVAMDDVQDKLGKRTAAAEWAHRFKDNALTSDQMSKFVIVSEIAGIPGKELADSIIASKTKAEMIEDGIAARMAAFDRPDRAQLREQALKAIHSEQSAELLALERGILAEMILGKEIRQEVSARKREEAKIEAAAVRVQARAILEKKSIREAGAFRVFYTAERNAAIRVSKAISKKDMAAATEAKKQQLLNHILASESIKLRAETEKAYRFLSKFEGRTDLMDMPYAFVRQIDSLLVSRGIAEPRFEDEVAMLGIAKGMAAKGESAEAIANMTGLQQDPNGNWIPEQLFDLVARINDDYHAITLPDSIFNQNPRKIDSMSVGEFRDLRDTIKLISEIGRKHERFLTAFIQADMKTAAKELRQSIEEKVGTPYAEDRKLGSKYSSELAKKAEAISRLPDAATPLMVNLLTLAKFLDGGAEDGPAHRLLYRILKDAEREKITRMEKVMEQVNAIFADHYKPEEMAAYKVKDFRFDFLINNDGTPRYLSREEILVVLLNWGNDGNRDRIRSGFGEQIGGHFVPMSDENIQRMIDALGKNDFDFAQAIWDHLQTYWPDVVKLEMLSNGTQPEPVQSVTVQSRYGQYRGGYYPIAFDFEKSAQASKNEDERNALYKQYSTAAAHTAHGHTEARVAGGVKRPVRLSLDVLFNHLENVVHDLSYRPAVIDMNRFIKHSDVRLAIENALGIPGLRSIEETIKSVASDQGDHNGFWDSQIKSFRAAFTISVLGARLIRFVPDIAVNISNTVWQLGVTRTRRAILEFSRSPLESKAFVNDKSAMMRNRAKLIDRDIHDISRKWEGRKSAIQQYAFVIQAAADELLSYPIWLETYNHHISEKGERVAAQIADEAVISTFGSGSEIDRVGVQRGGEKQKLLSMFYSWNSMMFNRMWLEGKLGGLAYEAGNAGAVISHAGRMAVYGIMLPALLETVLLEALRNAKGQDDEGRQRRMLARILQQPFGYIWMVRDIASYAIEKAITGRATYRLSPIESALETLLSPIADATNIAFTTGKHFDQKFGEKAARSASAVLGYPQLANDIFFNIVDWLGGRSELTWKDFISREKKK